MKGFDELLSGAQKMKKVVPHALNNAGDDFMDIVYAKSQALVPVDLGPLKESAGDGPDTTQEGNYRENVIEYGEGIDYAVYVHEIPPHEYVTTTGKQSGGHKHAPPTQWKYLSQPFDEEVEKLEPKLGDALDKSLRESFQ